MKIKNSYVDILSETIIYGILICLTIVTIIPFMQVISISFSPTEVINEYGMHLFPKKITLSGYKTIIAYDLVWKAYINSFIRVALGTVLSLFLYVLGGYPLAKRKLPHRKFWTWFIFFTMYFNGGLIPTYLLIKSLGLLDNFLALILPSAINVFTLLIVRNFIQMLPVQLEESAKIDGANDIQILFKVIIPLSKPVLATVALWTIVFYWNEWFQALLYIQSESKVVLQLVLRRILIDQSIDKLSESDFLDSNTESMKMAILVITLLPVMCVYPFLQKYFVKGVTVGSLKG